MTIFFHSQCAFREIMGASYSHKPCICPTHSSSSILELCLLFLVYLPVTQTE